MSLPTNAIQTALLLRLRADTTLQGLLVGSSSPSWSIYDEGGVPTNRAFPYITTYPITEQQGTGLVMGLDGVDSYVQVSVFTQTGASGGFAQARGIAAQAYKLLQPPAKPLDLSASGLSNFFCMSDNKTEQMGQDGISQQIVMRFHLMTQG
jgi:Protein of unknown function (DUF3168)